MTQEEKNAISLTRKPKRTKQNNAPAGRKVYSKPAADKTSAIETSTQPSSIDTPTQTPKKSRTTEIINKTTDGGYIKTRSNSTGSATMNYTPDGKMVPGSMKIMYADGSTAHQVLNPETGTYDIVKVPVNKKTTTNSTTETQSAAYNSIQESLASLWSYGINAAKPITKSLISLTTGITDTINITASTIKSAILKIFEQLAPQIPAKTKNEIATMISSEPIPTSTDSTEIKASWITRTTQRIYEAIFGTPEEQLAKTLATEYQDTAQSLSSSGLVDETSNATKTMILSIINDVQPTLSQAAKEELIHSIVMSDQTTEKPSLPDFLSIDSINPENIKADPALWQNSNEWSTNHGAFDPAKFNTWMTKTVKLINEKAPAASPAVESSLTSSTSGPAQTTDDLQIVV